MVVIPIKCLPYLLLIGGGYALVSPEENSLLGVVFVIIGAVWLYLKHNAKE